MGSKGDCLLLTALTVTAAIAYALLATPEYKVETFVQPVALADLDELSESGLYKLLPIDALNTIGSSMQSYDIRLKFFKANPRYFAPLQVPGESFERTFEKFNKKAFSLQKIDPKKAPALPKPLAFVELSTRHRAFGRIAEQPVLPSDDEGPDRTLGGVVVDGQVALLDVPFQFAPVVCQVGNNLAKCILRGHVWERFLHPGLQLTHHLET